MKNELEELIQAINDSINNANDFFALVVEVFGEETQIDIMIEECCELVQALIKYRRNCCLETHEQVQEELADTILMTFQLAFMFGSPKIFENIQKKVNRLEERLHEAVKKTQEMKKKRKENQKNYRSSRL